MKSTDWNCFGLKRNGIKCEIFFLTDSFRLSSDYSGLSTTTLNI